MKPGPKRSSVVWEHFRKTSDKVTICNICKKEFKFYGNTTNLREHLKRKHPASLLSPHESENEPTIEADPVDVHLQNPVAGPSKRSDSPHSNQRPTEPVLAAIKLGPTSQGKSVSMPKRPRQLKLFGSTRGDGLTPEMKDEIDKALLQMIALDYQPLSMVENKGFINYCQKLNPHYQLPSRKHLTAVWLINTYQEESQKIKTTLTDVANLAVTTDIWTSDSNKAYISVTVHFIYNDQIFSPSIATKEMEDAHHTGENIAKALNSIFEEWDIGNKIVTVVSDNGANIKSAVRQMNKHHHPCVAHTLNLTVSESLDSIALLDTIIKKCRALVGHFKHSVVATQTLKEMQIQMDLPILKVKQDVRTRWNSCLIMMERLLKIKAPLSGAITSLPLSPAFLDAAEWQIINDCVSVLKPIEDITTVLSGEKYPTISMVPPLIRGLQISLKNKVMATDVGNQLKAALLDSISRRLGSLEANKVVSKATLLDPRFKKLAFGILANANNAQTLVQEELVSMVSVQREEETPTDAADSVEKEDSIWAFLDTQVKRSKTHIITPNVTGTMMLRQYLELPYLSRTSDPLDFWKTHSKIFPDFYCLQAKYLCIPATSVPSERIFSKAGTNGRRNRLNPKNLDMIIFLNSVL